MGPVPEIPGNRMLDFPVCNWKWSHQERDPLGDDLQKICTQKVEGKKREGGLVWKLRPHCDRLGRELHRHTLILAYSMLYCFKAFISVLGSMITIIHCISLQVQQTFIPVLYQKYKVSKK